jgi:hypothetical protein
MNFCHFSELQFSSVELLKIIKNNQGGSSDPPHKQFLNYFLK